MSNYEQRYEDASGEERRLFHSIGYRRQEFYQRRNQRVTMITYWSPRADQALLHDNQELHLCSAGSGGGNWLLFGVSGASGSVRAGLEA